MTQTKTCLHCNTIFDITQTDLDFYTSISPTYAGTKFQVPAPKLCPGCRQQRRMAFRNERNLYRRTCDASGKQIISMFSPDCPYKVYETKLWYSDSWDPMSFGRDFDFSKTFTENMKELSLAVPRPSMYNFFAENSDYCNCTSYQKDCYLTSASRGDEKCLYSAYTNNSSNCVDNFMTFECENCYMTIDCEKSYKLLYSSNCRNCSESYFLVNCNDCSFCRGCEGLENKKYCIDNVQYEKDDYNLKLETLKREYWEDALAARKHKKQGETILFSAGSSGHHIRNCKNAVNCVDVGTLEDCKNCTWLFDSKDCQDIYSRGQNSQMCYEDVAIGESVYGILFSSNVNTNAKNVLYSMHCRSSSNCFGCVGLCDAEYCIFNKQYTKNQYEELVSKIIGHMQTTGERGEFFHPSLSPFGYNQTIAQEYYPMINYQGSILNSQGDSAIDIAPFGYHWSDYEAPKPVSDKVIKGSDLPNSIDVVEDSILQNAIECEVSGKLFRIQPQELAFYRKHGIPLPRKHPDVRHLERLELRK